MRLISQVAKEIWICDNKTIEKYRGDILNFKMDMRKQLGIDEDLKLRGDASVKATEKEKPKAKPAPQPKLEVVKPVVKSIPEEKPVVPPVEKEKTPAADDATATTASTASSGDAPKRYIPPHLRKKMAQG